MLCRTPRCSIMFVFGTCAPTTRLSPRSRRCARITLFPSPMLIATSSTAASSRYCSPHATSTSASYPPRHARAGSIRGFIYTHGFGVVVSEVNKITPDGLPVLLIETHRPKIKSPGFRLTRSEIYYGESTQDPVFVHTAREEFDYPSGDQNKYSTYQGTGGF